MEIPLLDFILFQSKNNNLTCIAVIPADIISIIIYWCCTPSLIMIRISAFIVSGTIICEWKNTATPIVHRMPIYGKNVNQIVKNHTKIIKHLFCNNNPLWNYRNHVKNCCKILIFGETRWRHAALFWLKNIARNSNIRAYSARNHH